MDEPGGGPSTVRTDEQILGDADDVELLRAVAAGRFTTRREYRRALQRLTREDCILGGLVVGSTPILLHRGERILSAAEHHEADPAQ